MMTVSVSHESNIPIFDNNNQQAAGAEYEFFSRR